MSRTELLAIFKLAEGLHFSPKRSRRNFSAAYLNHWRVVIRHIPGYACSIANRQNRDQIFRRNLIALVNGQKKRPINVIANVK